MEEDNQLEEEWRYSPEERTMMREADQSPAKTAEAIRQRRFVRVFKADGTIVDGNGDPMERKIGL